MTAVMPIVTIDGDGHNRIMARFGDIIGFSKWRVVWSFGWMEGSDMAKLTGVHTDAFTIVVADYDGKIVAIYKMPNDREREHYLRIVNSRW